MPKFVVQRHHAERAGLHDDLRLELKPNKLYSWAVPKLVPTKPNKKVLAIETEIHDMSWYNFEGKIDEGYGKGIVKIVDRGKMTILKHTDKVIIVNLNGNKHKIDGTYVLVNIKNNQWLLWKRKTA